MSRLYFGLDHDTLGFHRNPTMVPLPVGAAKLNVRLSALRLLVFTPYILFCLIQVQIIQCHDIVLS